MARNIGSSDKVSQGTTAFPTTGTLSLWINPTWAKTDGVWHTFFSITDGTDANQFRIIKYGDNTIYAGWIASSAGNNVAVGSGSYTLNQNAWNHLGASWNASGITLYLNGSSIGTAGTQSTWSTAGHTRTLGDYTGFSADSGASFAAAEYGLWGAVLSAGDIAALAKGANPLLVLPSSLTDYLPLLGRTSPEPNIRGGTAGTLTGTAQADHPRVYYPGRHRTAFVPGAGGGTVVSGYGTAAGVNLTTAESQARFAVYGAAGGNNSGVGEGRSRHQSAGTAAGTASVVGVSAARVEAVGAAAGSNVSTGVGRIRKAGSGVAAGTNSATGASQARAALIGAAAGTNDTDAVSRALWEASGSADGTNTATGYIIDGNAPPTWMRNLQILKKGVS